MESWKVYGLMADQKKVDKTGDKISSIYTKGIEEIVGTLLDNRNGATNEEFSAGLLALDMKEIVKSKLQNIQKEYINAHIEVLKDIKPPVK